MLVAMKVFKTICNSQELSSNLINYRYDSNNRVTYQWARINPFGLDIVICILQLRPCGYNCQCIIKLGSNPKHRNNVRVMNFCPPKHFLQNILYTSQIENQYSEISKPLQSLHLQLVDHHE